MPLDARGNRATAGQADALSLFLREVGRRQLLTAAQELELAPRLARLRSTYINVPPDLSCCSYGQRKWRVNGLHEGLLRISQGRFAALTQPALRLNFAGHLAGSIERPATAPKGLVRTSGSVPCSRSPSELIIANLEPWSPKAGNDVAVPSPFPRNVET
jgi:hypothetical protein